MRRDPRVHLLDVLDAVHAVLTFMNGRTREESCSDRLLRSAVDREFEIVGEALNRLRRDDAAVAARVPAVAEIIGFRNVLIHGYDIGRNRPAVNASTRTSTSRSVSGMAYGITAGP